MSYHDWLRFVVIACTFLFAVLVAIQVWVWHKAPNAFNLREYFTALGKDGKQHPSRAALGELVALFATTSGYLGALAVKPDIYTEATAVYGSIWCLRGGFSTYLRSKGK